MNKYRAWHTCKSCGASLSHRAPQTKYCNKKCYRNFAPDHVLRGINDPIEDRIMRKVEFEPNTGCWLYSGSTNRFGYPMIHYQGSGKMAHRLMYEVHNGPIPAGLVMRHKCDTPQCVNPGHLETGTQQENIDDKIRRGRNRVAVGEEYAWPHTKLTEEQVLDIRSRVGQGQRSMAREFNVSQTCIRLILIGKNWKHLP